MESPSGGRVVLAVLPVFGRSLISRVVAWWSCMWICRSRQATSAQRQKKCVYKNPHLVEPQYIPGRTKSEILPGAQTKADWGGRQKPLFIFASS